MWNKKTFTVLCSLALAGSMAVPAFAAEGICGQEALIAAPYASVVAEKPTVTAGEDLFTRAELVSALHQKAGSPVVNFAMQYTDVEQGAEYAEAIRWASSEKIAGGYGEDQFGPEDPVTREQMALILYRYAQNNDQGFTGVWAFPLNYSDASQISEYAYEAICWVTMKDVMGEKEEQAFVPQGTVTQQEADTMLTQYFTVLEQADGQ